MLAYNPDNNDPLPAPGGGEEGFGGGYPAVMWRLAMQQILQSYPKVSFPAPDPAVEAGTGSSSSNGSSGGNSSDNGNGNNGNGNDD